MNNDIVIGNVKYRRIQGVWTMTPSGTGDLFHIDPRRRELLDEIERLRAENQAFRDQFVMAEEIREAFAHWDGTDATLPEGWIRQQREEKRNE